MTHLIIHIPSDDSDSDSGYDSDTTNFSESNYPDSECDIETIALASLSEPPNHTGNELSQHKFYLYVMKQRELLEQYFENNNNPEFIEDLNNNMTNYSTMTYAYPDICHHFCEIAISPFIDSEGNPIHNRIRTRLEGLLYAQYSLGTFPHSSHHFSFQPRGQ